MVAVRLIHNKSRNHTCLVVVDDEHRELLYGRTWAAHHSKGHYYMRDHGHSLHREVLGVTTGVIDHANRNTCDNQRANLRIATLSQNGWNRGVNRNSKSGCKGVWYHKTWAGNDRWVACVAKDNKRHSKYFTSKDAAVQWARTTREELHGEYARHA